MKNKKKYKKRVVLSHEEKRLVAKQVLDGRHAKQIAADWNISQMQFYDIVRTYLVVVRHEKYPDQSEFILREGPSNDC